ncbi:hypothetical protein D9M70_601880 [compost metagenome]
MTNAPEQKLCAQDGKTNETRHPPDDRFVRRLGPHGVSRRLREPGPALSEGRGRCGRTRSHVFRDWIDAPRRAAGHLYDPVLRLEVSLHQRQGRVQA